MESRGANSNKWQYLAHKFQIFIHICLCMLILRPAASLYRVILEILACCHVWCRLFYVSGIAAINLTTYTRQIRDLHPAHHLF